MEAEADAKKWENLWAEAEEEKAEMAEEARRAIETLSQQWAASISTVHSTLLSQIDSLTSRVEAVANSLPRVHGAAVRWKMRAWEAEGLVHQLETEKLKEQKRKVDTSSPVHEAKCASPSREVQRLAAKLWQEETKARHLESSLRNEKDHTSKIINGKRNFCSVLTWLYLCAWTCLRGCLSLAFKPVHIYLCSLKCFGGIVFQLTVESLFFLHRRYALTRKDFITSAKKLHVRWS
jgi:hypothetical protein